MRRPLIQALSAVVLATSLVAPASANANPFPASAGEASLDYIVVFNEGTNARLQAALLGQAGAKVPYVYENVFPGVAASLTARQVRVLESLPFVRLIERDAEVSISVDQNPATWGLDRIDQRALPLNSTYSYSGNGAGVTAYIIDTGIAAHSDFSGRLSSGYSAIADANGTTDCNGHGTHVAGTVGGTTYGVAKSVTLVPVRVLGCDGSGSWGGVVAGMDWVAGNATAPSVANMSLGGGKSTAVNDAVARLTTAGVTTVVAAGNSNANACNYSPASAPSAITVGATTSSDGRASYSNFGSCLDIFAPGSSITSTWLSGSTRTISGTSMASPHVAGAAALILGSNTSASPSAVTSTLRGQATTSVVVSAGTGSPNLLLFTNPTGSAVTDPGTAPAAPTNVRASGSKNINVSWTAPTGTVDYYLVYVYEGSSLNLVYTTPQISGTTTSVTITGLRSKTQYAFRVKAVNGVGESPYSSYSNSVTTR